MEALYDERYEQKSVRSLSRSKQSDETYEVNSKSFKVILEDHLSKTAERDELLTTPRVCQMIPNFSRRHCPTKPTHERQTKKTERLTQVQTETDQTGGLEVE